VLGGVAVTRATHVSGHGGRRKVGRDRAALSARRAAAARRQRECRVRKAAGLAQYTVAVPEALLISALIKAEKISETDALDPAHVEKVLGALLTKLAQRWALWPL